MTMLENATVGMIVSNYRNMLARKIVISSVLKVLLAD